MGVSYLKRFQLAIILSASLLLPELAHAAPSDNDETYQLPAYVPKAALPKNGKKILFNDNPSDDDEVYAAPPQGSPQPALNPQAQADYQKKYAEYQRQLAIYNQQMAAYKKALAARQAQQKDNDSTYDLPGQYHNTPPVTAPVQHSQQYQQRYDYNDQNANTDRESISPNTQGLPDSIYY